MPLLLVIDHPTQSGSLLTVGPVDEGGDLHSVDPDGLAEVLRRVSAMPPLEAVRELAGELERLDQAVGRISPRRKENVDARPSH